jgi:hypothetical protein
MINMNNLLRNNDTIGVIEHTFAAMSLEQMMLAHDHLQACDDETA